MAASRLAQFEARLRQSPVLSFAARTVARWGGVRHSALFALILLAAYPVLSGGLPTTGDGLIHYYRAAELEWHIRHGDLYPRWFANLGYGFGLPVLNYYSPLTYYIPLLFRLFGLPLPIALQLSYALALAVAIIGACVWVCEFGEADDPQTPLPVTPRPSLFAPLLAAAAYGLAPYFYFNIFHRGAYPETWALAFAPWLLWAAHRLAVSRRSLFIVHCSLFISALILTHALSAFVLVPIALLYGLAVAIFEHGWRAIVSFVARHFSFVILIPLALTAFFTLPVLAESHYIQLSRTYSTGDLDYRRNFLTLAGLLSPPPNFDPLLVFNAMPPSLGWPQLGLGLLAAGGWLLAQRRPPAGFTRTAARWGGVVHWSLVILLSAAALSLAEPLWNLIPFARFIQFPWRLVGPASLFLSAPAASAIGAFPTRRRRLGVLGFGILSFFLFSLPWTYHADFSLQSPVSDSPADTIRYEISTGQLGTSSTGEYLPRWVAELPDPQTLLPQFAAAEIPSRLAPLPAAVTSYVSRNTLNAETLEYKASAPFTLTFNLFYFPGWAATLDGRPIAIEPSAPHGLVTIAAPAGTHTLRLERRLTPPQVVGSLISLASLIGVIIVIARRRPAASRPHTSVSPVAAPEGNAASSFIVSLFIVSLLLIRILWLDRTETVFHYTRPIPNATSVNFDNQIELIGYELAPTAGQPIQATLYWRALQPLSADYSVSVQLADRFGHRFGQSDNQHPNGVPTSRWRVEQYARDVHSLLPLDGAPPGDYRLLVTVYGGRPLSLLENGAPAGVEYELGRVRIEAGESGQPGPLALLDAELAADSVMVGDQLALTALWFAGEQSLPALDARIEIVDEAGRVLYAESVPPAGPDYPTGQWQAGSRVRYPLSVTLPPDMPDGPARVQLSLVGADGAAAAGPYDIGSITVITPERSFDLPPMQVRVDHDFDGSIRLLGYTIDENTITLYWQSLKAVKQRLTVFVHTLDESGAFVSGHDAAPARATTGWLPGEVIVDVHPIVITNRFEVGVYDPITGERFGETFVTVR